jgi:hypothetical protein
MSNSNKKQINKSFFYSGRSFTIVPINEWFTENIAFYKTSGHNEGYDIFVNTWFPTTGILEHQTGEYEEGTIIKTQYFVENFKYKNTNTTKEWFFPKWFIPIFEKTNEHFKKDVLNSLKYLDILKYLYTITDLDTYNDYYSYFKEWENIIKFLRYFFTEEQFVISSQFGGGYWENNTITQYIKSIIDENKTIYYKENVKNILNNTKEVNDYLKENNAYFGFNEEEFYSKYNLNENKYTNGFAFYLGSYFTLFLKPRERFMNSSIRPTKKNKTKKGGKKRVLKKHRKTSRARV